VSQLDRLAYAILHRDTNDAFSVLNGVKQGGIVSLFCICIDDLLCSLAKSEVGCFIGNFVVSALAYVDDIVLLAPSVLLPCVLCDEYSTVFNRVAYVEVMCIPRCMLFTPKRYGAALFNN